MKFQMPPHTNLFDNLKNNNSEERITNVQKSGAHLYQTAQANVYSSSSSNIISNTNLISNINIISPLPTPIPILSSSTFNFSSIIESELLDSSSQESSTKDINTNSVSERDYLESCIEQMENNEIMPAYDILESMFDPNELQNSLNITNAQPKYSPSASSYNNNMNNENQSLINFNIFSSNNINNNQLYNQINPAALNYSQIEIKQEKQDLDETNSLYNNTAVIIPKTKTVKKNGKLVNEKHYGPIVVRPRKNPAPTLASGRKSKYAQLTAEEEYRREIRRRRNRLAAEKCKFKRNEIEEKLEIDLVNLHNEHHILKGENETLLAKKLRLEKLLNEHTQTCSSGSSNTTNSNVTNIVIANIDYQTNTQINYSLNHTNSSQLHTAHNDNQAYFSNDSFNTSIYSTNNNTFNQQQIIYDQQTMNANQSHNAITNFQTPQILGNQPQFSRQNSHFQYNQYNRYV